MTHFFHEPCLGLAALFTIGLTCKPRFGLSFFQHVFQWQVNAVPGCFQPFQLNSAAGPSAASSVLVTAVVP